MRTGRAHVQPVPGPLARAVSDPRAGRGRGSDDPHRMSGGYRGGPPGASGSFRPCGLLALYAALADGPAEPRALRGLVLGVAGTGLVGPAVGVEVFAMPVIGRLYLDG